MNHPAITPSTPVRVGIIDDDALVRRLLSPIIDSAADLCVSWAVSSGEEALERLTPGAASSPPAEVDVLMLDIHMPGMNGIETASAAHAVRPDLPIIMLTTLDRQEHVSEATRAGAVGFLRKDDHQDRLTAAVRAAHQGVSVFSPETAAYLVEGPASRAGTAPTTCPLTPRELQVLELVSQSLTNGQIGHRLGVSESTVKSQISSIIQKLGCVDRVGMVKWGFHHGLLR